MEQSGLEFLSNLFTKVQIFSARPDIQTQLVIIAVILVLAWLASKPIIFLLNRFVPAQPEDDGQTEDDVQAADDKTPSVSAHGLRLGEKLTFWQAKSFWQYILPVLRQLVFPVLALIGANLAVAYLLGLGALAGLVELLLFILWVLFFYRLFLGISYALFSKEAVRRFQTRLFAPLFMLFVAYLILSLFVDVITAAGLILTNLFDNPLTVGSLFVATVGLYLWINAVWGLNRIIFGLATRFMSINEGRLEASLALMGYILIGFGLAAALSVLGISATAFAAIAGGLSVGIGFGLREILSNFISGILLLFEGSISPGDFIDVDGNWSEVEKMNIRSTLVTTFDGFEIIVPNQKFLTSSVINYTGEDKLYRTKLDIKVDYDSDTKKIQEILTRILQDNPHCHSRSRTGIKDFSESGYIFRVEIWVDCTSVGFTPLYDSIIVMIRDEFEKHNIKFYIPKRVVIRP